jgi:apolipoprotein N-acyltransferase
MNPFTDHLTLMIIAAVLSLPAGLLVAFQVSLPRSRFLAMIGGVIGAAVVGFAIYWAVEATGISLDALTYFLGCLFACSAGVIIGAVLVNFLLDVITGASDASSQEL